MEGMNEYKVKEQTLSTKDRVDEIFEEVTKLGVHHVNLENVTELSHEAAAALIDNCRETRTTLVRVDGINSMIINYMAAKDIYA